MNVQITGITLNSDPQPMGQRGGRILASFDCTIGGIGLFGRAYVQNFNGSFSAMPPKVWNQKDKRLRVAILDPELRREIREAAATAYANLA